ncbi:MAG: SGNH/GDSL hydrolase family protein [Ruminococcaceae bacterium]|nr:SGNH/GDSL hydrolase family protein [Oscillospiraceae bacterium]
MKKKLICCFCILLVGGILLWLAQLLVVPKYMTSNREGALVGEYYSHAGANDVLFLGDCEVYESFTPPTLWEEYGITSYVRGTPQQLIWQSYYLLEDTLRYETPKAVVFNVYAMRYGEPQNEAYNRITLDGMELSPVKLRAVLASMTEEESLTSYLFPLLRFHSRWKELGAEDFRYLLERDHVSHNGYLMQTGVSPMEAQIAGTPLMDYAIPEICWDYLNRMRDLCREKGIELILVKAPTNFWKYYWYDEWEEQIVSYAEEHQLSYYNFIPLAEEIGLDWSVDTYDGGAHLNVTGAEKLTSYFGAILREDHGIADRRGEEALLLAWNEKTERYRWEKTEATHE